MTTSTIVLDKVETIVVESGGPLEAIVTESNNTVVIQSEASYAIVAGTIGPQASSINSMQDVDLTDLSDGSLLIYNTGTSKWTAGNLLEKQIIESGQY